MEDMDMTDIKNIPKPIQQPVLNHISIKKFGLAFGATGAMMYLGCALVMLILGHESSVKIFNTLLHGIDVTAIIRMDISPVEEIFGIVQTFILGWLIGACIAAIYNSTLQLKIN